MTHDPQTGSELTRRAVVAGTGLLAVSAALAACSNNQQPAAAPGSQASSPTTQPPPETSTSAAPPGALLTTTDNIPAGGGKVFAADKVVVTQPTSGTFKAFSAICTHQGCTVNKVADGTIDCPCHGSKFAIADGSVVHGPAQRSLAPRQIVVSGDEVLLQD
ncbi:MAG: Rieske (2Fe-2S) protein [Pseudonocardiales bacterium]|jgi:Rieske Fe-S protein|nr:Rieske (2Fe-2S) protein [Pseudonocardiales bacterium]MBV9652441.1 Rieske (2Fe-2S) protein [Pseudonocardiales bacterium]